MVKRRNYQDRLYAHFVTFSCYHKRRLLNHDATRSVVLGSQIAKQQARLVGFVLMPDHVHAIVWFPKLEQLPIFLKQWKQRSSKIIRRDVLPTLSSYGSTIGDDDPFWQRKYYAFQIYEPQKLREKLE